MHQIVTHRCCGHDVPRLADLQVIETAEKSQNQPSSRRTLADKSLPEYAKSLLTDHRFPSMSVASQNDGQVAQCAGLALHRKHVTASLRWPTNAIEKVNCALPFCKHVRGSFDRRVTTAGRHMHVTCCAQGNAHGLLAQAPPICHWAFPQSAARSLDCSPGGRARRSRLIPNTAWCQGPLQSPHCNAGEPHFFDICTPSEQHKAADSAECVTAAASRDRVSASQILLELSQHQNRLSCHLENGCL